MKRCCVSWFYSTPKLALLQGFCAPSFVNIL
nr:MAG TPA: hypothetical protein [Caudoviricetes sp.]